MAKYSIEDTTLTNIANAIRSKTGSSDGIKVEDYEESIMSIESGGSNIETCNVTIINNLIEPVDFFYVRYSNNVESYVGCAYEEDSTVKNDVVKGTYIIIQTDALVNCDWNLTDEAYVNQHSSNLYFVALHGDNSVITIG